MGRECKEQQNSHFQGLDHTLPLNSLHNPYNLGPSLFCNIPRVSNVGGTEIRMPQIQYRQEQSQELTRSMEKELKVAVPSPVIRKVRPPLVFANPEPPPRGGEGPGSKRNILVA